MQISKMDYSKIKSNDIFEKCLCDDDLLILVWKIKLLQILLQVKKFWLFNVKF